jgi:FixJ family two-component response regulator
MRRRLTAADEPIQPRVAVVDDDPSVRRALGRLLRSASYAVSDYASGEAMLADPDIAHFGCLVLDLHLPGLGGRDVYRRLESEHRLPARVVIITADCNPLMLEWAARHGTLLRKPFDSADLLAAVAPTD